MNKEWPALGIAVLTTVLVTHTYMVYGTDKVAALTGYLFALGVLPVLAGVGLGTVAAMIAARAEGIEMKSLLYMPAIGGVSALLPIGWTLLMMSGAH